MLGAIMGPPFGGNYVFGFSIGFRFREVFVLSALVLL